MEEIRALFTAQETISDALSKAKRATSSFDRALTDLQVGMTEAGIKSEGATQEFDEFARASMRARETTSLLDRAVNAVDRAFLELAGGTEVTEQQIESFTKSVQAANLSTRVAEQGVDVLRNSLGELMGTGQIAGKSVSSLQNKIAQLRISTSIAGEGIDEINQDMIQLFGAATVAEKAQNRFNRELKDTAISASMASGQLGILASIAETTSFRFSSLSVNIGPFNLALRNILVQLPAILTGMGTLLALVTALGTAFLTAAAGLSALVGVGGIAFFEEFSKQFEETGEAVEQLMAALKDLFIEALEPLMTEANMDLFIESIDYAARLVNRFAQFFAQMRDDILAFTSGVGADIDILFEALHDSFVMMTPILQDLVQWFIKGFPSALMTFSKMTKQISNELGMMAAAFGNLFFQLLDFATLLISSVGPVIALVIQGLADLFASINRLNDAVIGNMLQLVALTAVFLKLRGTIRTLFGAFGVLHRVMLQQAAAGNFLGSVYYSLASSINLLRNTQYNLSESLSLIRKQWERNIAVTRANIAATKTMIAQKYAAAKAALTWSNAQMIANAASRTIGRGLSFLHGQLLALSNAIRSNVVATWLSIKARLTSAYATYTQVGALGMLSSALASAKAMWIANTGLTWTNVKAKLANAAANLSLSASSLTLAGALGVAAGAAQAFWASLTLGILPAIVAIIGAISLVVAAIMNFDAIASAIGGTLNFLKNIFMAIAKLIITVLVPILNVLLIPFQVMISLIQSVANFIGGLIDKFLKFIGISEGLSSAGNAFQWILNTIDKANDFVAFLIKQLNRIPGIDIGGPALDAKEIRASMEGESEEQDKSDIQTEPDVNLSFEDKLEQNVDVQADPEDKAQLSRLTKDAIAEANSFARRQQGGQ